MQPYLPYIIPAIATISVAIITSLTTLLGVYLKERYFPKLKQQKLSTTKSTCYIELDKICASIKDIVKANLVYIAYFHNGGHFINGVAMDKYTVVGEDYDVNCKSVKRTNKDVLVNNFPYLFHDLLVRNRHCVNSVSTQAMEDRSYKEDLENRGMKSAYTFLIKDPVKDIPIGFISLEYFAEHGFNAEDEKYIWKKQNTIAKLLNMNK
jgi:hypothetical protein